jgi:hypothetical protein
MDTHMFCCRHWQSRRVVITREVIAFAYTGDSNMLDYIPLSEIIGIENLQQDRNQKSSSVLFEKAVSVVNALQIQTAPEGYNSGRKYFLQTETESERDQLVHDLKRRVKRASKELISSFKRRQMYVKRIYNSNVVQSFAALLIFLVQSVLTS